MFSSRLRATHGNNNSILMFSLGDYLQYYLCVGDVDMRKGVDGLSGVARNQMGRDPLSGEVFIFMSRGRTIVKILQWQRGGFVLYYKRLETGRFELPFYDCRTGSHNLQWSTLVMMMEGIRIKDRYFSRRYEILKKCV